MKKHFSISFNNAIRDGAFDKLPNHKGIYMFRLTEITNNRWRPEVVYIGVAENDGGLKGRVNEFHEHINDARKLVKKEKDKGRNVILTIAYTDENNQNDDSWKQIEAALIFCKKPVINTDGKESFNYCETTIDISGTYHNDLKEQYTAHKTQ